MAFRDFTVSKLKAEFGLTIKDARLYETIPPVFVRDEFLAFLRDGVDLAIGIATEKAKSEFIIAPVLLELKRTSNYSFAIFSGITWEADASLGLNGTCDFMLTRSASQSVFGEPFVAVVEAKNDLIPDCIGQCIAAMYGAQLCNAASGDMRPIHGIVSTGSSWRFLRFDGLIVLIDLHEYTIENVHKLMGILHSIVA